MKYFYQYNAILILPKQSVATGVAMDVVTGVATGVYVGVALSSELLLCFLDLQILNQDVVIFYVGLQYLVLHSLYIPFS